MLKLYENIKELRLRRGLTQSQLADKLGYADKSMIAKIEAGQIDLSHSKIIAFAKVLAVDPGELMGWEDVSSSFSDQADALFIEKYGQPVFDAAMIYSSLDELDRGKIDERMNVLLEDEKYQKRSHFTAKAI